MSARLIPLKFIPTIYLQMCLRLSGECVNVLFTHQLVTGAFSVFIKWLFKVSVQAGKLNRRKRSTFLQWGCIHGSIRFRGGISAHAEDFIPTRGLIPQQWELLFWRHHRRMPSKADIIFVLPQGRWMWMCAHGRQAKVSVRWNPSEWIVTFEASFLLWNWSRNHKAALKVLPLTRLRQIVPATAAAVLLHWRNCH